MHLGLRACAEFSIQLFSFHGTVEKWKPCASANHIPSIRTRGVSRSHMATAQTMCSFAKRTQSSKFARVSPL